MNKRILPVMFWGMWLMAVGVALVSARYFSLNPEVFFPQQREVYLANSLPLLAHAGGGIVALILGPLLLCTGRRALRWPWHRRLGIVYFIAIAVGGAGGMALARTAYGGASARLGFLALALLWCFTAIQGLRHIRARRHALHRCWMWRNYALTFEAVTLRIWFPVLEMLGLPLVEAYRTVAWLCWVPNLLLVEWWLAAISWNIWKPDPILN